MRQLPPLLSARAFEVAARLGSFHKAADELHVTPSAISHQIRSLENFLGVELFQRNHRGVTLTVSGDAYVAELRDAFDVIAAATADLRQGKLRGNLSVGATSAFISRWILPRLNRFNNAYPQIELDLKAIEVPINLAKSVLDVVICMGPRDWTGQRADRILKSPIFPVCSPKVAEQLQELSSLRNWPLLHYDNGEEWARWLKAAHIENVDSKIGPRFNDCNLMLQAAVEAYGVGLTFTALADRELQAGLLVKPFKQMILPEAWYYVASPQTLAERPKVAAFRSWVLSEANAEVSDIARYRV